MIILLIVIALLFSFIIMVIQDGLIKLAVVSFSIIFLILSSYNLGIEIEKEIIIKESSMKKIPNVITKEEIIKSISFEDSVYNYIKSLNIKHPDVVFKQARIESGNFTSDIFKENNNMFGMKIPYKRANTIIGENRGYAVYNNWKECILDYALYQTYSGKNMTREEYINLLGDSYAEDLEYKQKIK